MPVSVMIKARLLLETRDNKIVASKDQRGEFQEADK
jgi:hypothetical protein